MIPSELGYVSPLGPHVALVYVSDGGGCCFSMGRGDGIGSRLIHRQLIVSRWKSRMSELLPSAEVSTKSDPSDTAGSVPRDLQK